MNNICFKETCYTPKCSLIHRNLYGDDDS